MQVKLGIKEKNDAHQLHLILIQHKVISFLRSKKLPKVQTF
jgi:hypothetical protein